MELQIRKIHLDSRFKLPGGSHSDFEVALPQMLETPENTIAFIDNITIPHSWTSVDESNRYLFLAERAGTSAPYVYSVRRLDIPQHSHSGTSYKTALQTALNTNTPAGISATYIVVHTLTTNKCAIAAPSSSVFHFLTDDEIKISDNAHYPIQKDNIKSGNSVIRNIEGGTATNAAQYTYTDVFTTGFMDFQNHHNIYINSSLAMFNSLGPMGQTSILAKCPVSSSYGNSINHSYAGAQDYVHIGRNSISTIRLSIRDAYSNLINLEGASWSCSIIFAVKE